MNNKIIMNRKLLNENANVYLNRKRIVISECFIRCKIL